MFSALAVNWSSVSSEKVHNPVKEHLKSFQRRVFVCGIQKFCLLDVRGVLESSTLNFSRRRLPWDPHFNHNCQGRFNKQMRNLFLQQTQAEIYQPQDTWPRSKL